ncbi:MAG: SMC-Scp complex subunit ScpB [Methanobacteriota archaeon]|nr:MAG: SMC-Scp complex subunit ScpB [Euryarchaeota archaeon]
MFVAGRPLSVEEMKKLVGTSSDEYVNKLIQILVSEYEERQSGITIRKVFSKYVMEVAPPYTQLVSRFAPKSQFSRATLKTLAYIAYKQPITQSKLVRKRGSQVYRHVKELVAQGFVDAKPHGKTLLLQTSSKFSEYYGFDSSDPKEVSRAIANILKQRRTGETGGEVGTHIQRLINAER